MEWRDLQCTYDDLSGINMEAVKGLNLSFPDAYLNWKDMANISKTLKEYNKACWCELPFCHTVEGEALGGNIHYGDEKNGPRANGYVCSALEEVLNLPEIDFTKGRIYEVLLACEALRNQGEQVVLKISGPFTILNILMDVRDIFRALKKQKELVNKVLQRLEKELLLFIEEAKRHGVQVISYADPLGGFDILGPRFSKQMVENFTYGFLQKIEEMGENNLFVILCPKTVYTLFREEKVRFVDIHMEEELSYGEACLSMLGKARFTGQICMKKMYQKLEENVFQVVELL